MHLRNSKDEILSKIYFTPDLTKKQREEAFKLRKMKCYRTNVLKEKNLKISRGQIVVGPPVDENPDGHVSEGEAEDGLHLAVH